MDNKRLLKLVQCALIAALAYIGFQVLRIDIPVGTERTALHLGNSFVVLGALLVGGPWGGVAGALGLTIADLTSGYVTSAPKTFLLKLIMGLITGFVAQKLMHKEEKPNVKDQTKIALISAAVALGCNVVLDPLVGYFYKTYIFGIPQDMAATLAKINSAATLVNTIVSTIIVTAVWPAIYTALKKANMLTWGGKK
ncbi:MAG: ECF transporter S component [Firmicutes bacterium]|nr:ECF transporter S component [Bacillota bacterium]